ncbi:hypothetical protein [Streptomyces sp. ISL-11]|uniref:hypothetical protein n=1 Tax=Streptomyces sp. ISL-11 TaxID=2819174 RepID=UPI001BE8686C|nr:hypothetical protein [Streptomyces sp. ISL-11]MBT2386673.1 hypothetical protein [Streptomyces sp. ISL-11]
MFRSNQRRRSVVLAGVSVVLLVPFGAFAAEPTPGSGQGGSPGPSAPAGYKVSTALPTKISVNKKSGNTSLTATVRNDGARDTGGIRLSVVGFKGLRITSVEGCSSLPAGQLPPGSNSAFACTIDKLAAGGSRAFKVTGNFDLRNVGQICLPVTLGDTKTLLWQQGPVHFGTTDTSSDAPDTPLLLGTKNVPSGAATSPGAGGTSAPPASGGATGGTGAATGAATPGRSAGGGPAASSTAPTTPGKEAPSELPRTGPSSSVVGTGALAAALLAAGAAGIWLTTRRRGRH